MSLTEEAFLLRKRKTWFAAQDVDNDGCLTTKDIEEIAKRFVEYGKLDEEKGKEIKKAYTEIMRHFGLKDASDKMTLEQYLANAKKFRENPSSEEIRKSVMGKNFDVVDTDGSGVISREEFRVYFKCMGFDESNAKTAFDGVDTDHDGSISRDEFLAAATEFFQGVDQKSGATLFFGPLLDWLYEVCKLNKPLIMTIELTVSPV